MEKTKIYLNYLRKEEKVSMTEALSFLRSKDKKSRASFEKIVGEVYGPHREFAYPCDNGHRPSEGTCGACGKYYHTIIQFEQKDLTEDALKALGSRDEWDWRYFYAISIGRDDRRLYLVSFSNACSPNWNNEYNVQRLIDFKGVNFRILTDKGQIYRMCDSLHAAINAELWRSRPTFVASDSGVRMAVKDQHGNYATIEGETEDDVFRDYADNYTGYRDYRRQMASEWEIVSDVTRTRFAAWKETAKGLKSSFDKFYGGGIVD